MSEDEELARPAAGTGAAARDDYGVGRLLALSDGVFAVAMTLLVVDVAVLPPPAHATTADGLRAFRQELPNLGIYGFSFAMVSVYWLNHHRALRSLRVATRRVLLRNLGLLGLVCLMPFATAFFQRFAGTAAGNQVYLGALFMLGLMSALTVPWQERARSAARGPGGRRHEAAIYVDQLGALPVFALGFVLATWIPGDAALIVLSLVLPLGIVRWILTRGLREPSPDPDPYGVGRMLALSDGVFAIALTLLVLNIAVPHLGASGTEAQAMALLARRRVQLTSFAITFIVVGVYWTAHHRALRRVTSIRHGILRRNLVLLFAICLVPFFMAFFDAWSATVFGNQFFFAALGSVAALTALIGPGVGRVRAGLSGGRWELRGVDSIVRTTGVVAIGVAGILLAPVLGPNDAPLVWLLMVPVVVAERTLSGERAPSGPR